MKIFRTLVLYLFVLFTLLSCDAPRINPLDPQNPDYDLGILDGFVRTNSSPQLPISNAKVLLKNTNIWTTTNSDGYFRFSAIDRVDGLLIFEAEGFYNDSISIEWSGSKTKRIADQILNYSLAGIDGLVRTETLPRTAIGGVQVFLKNQNVMVETADNGSFKMQNLKIQNGWLYFSKTGYSTDSVFVNLESQRNITIDFFMKKLPSIEGTVRNEALPRNIIPGVQVFWKNQNLLVETDNEGKFKLENLIVKNGWIYFSKSGYSSDSSFVDIVNQRNVSLEIFLRKMPQIEGVIKTVAFPRVALSGVQIYWKNQNIISNTDKDGKFSFENLNIKSGWLYYSKTGYSPDSTFVNLENQRNVSLELFMNKIPQIDNFSIYTVVTNLFPSRQLYRLYIQTTISDAENDVDSVFVRSQELNFNKQLFFNPSTRAYERDFDPNELGVSSLEEAVGKTFSIIAKDDNRKVFNIGSSNIKRIIKQEVTPRSPVNREIVAPNFTIIWNRFEPGFAFKYRVQIFSDDINRLLIWESGLISSNDVQVVVPNIITPGDYFWVILCIDEYQNVSKSKPASFVLQ